MPENTSLPLTEIAVSPDAAISPAVAAVLEKAHAWATEVIGRFAQNERNPFRYYLREANATIAYILGKNPDPQYFSEMIGLKKQFREQEAANGTNYEAEKKAA